MAKIVPTRVKINGKWYNTRGGFSGIIELTDSGKIAPTVEFTAKEPFAHMNDFFFIYDANGNKVGEIDVHNRKGSGCVADFEIPSGYSVNTDSEDSEDAEPENSGGSSGGKKKGVLWIIFRILVFLISPYFKLGLLNHEADRKEWWLTVLGMIARFFIIGLTLTFAGAFGNVVVIVMVYMVIPIIVVSLRRMLHIGKPKWWVFVPIVGFFMCGFFHGTNKLAEEYNKRGGPVGKKQKENVAGISEEGFSYAENSGRATIVKYEGQAKDVVIPERINNLPVSTIGNGAFANNQLTSVSVPDSLMYIGVGAFANNLLDDVSVPQSATIGEDAFDAKVKITRR